LSPNQPRLWDAPIDVTEVQTPAYIYSVDEVGRRLRALKDALRTTVIVSLKACPVQDIVSRIPSDLWDGVEVASRGELHMLAGLRSRHLYVNTPALTESLARSALGAQATFIIDSPAHLALIQRLRGRREVQPVMLRLSNRLVNAHDRDAPTLRHDQFGMDFKQACEAIDLARSLDIRVRGFHLYAGPHTFGRASRFVVDAAVSLLGRLESHAGFRFQTVNLGGGLEETWSEKGYDFAAYRRELARFPAHIELVHEFGRAIFATAGCFAVRVLFAKSIDGQRYAVCDGGMAQAFLLAQTENILRKYRTPRIFGPVRQSASGKEKTIICGSTCSRDDVIGETFETVEDGDVLLFDLCGAYFRSYAMNSFLQLGEANVYVV